MRVSALTLPALATAWLGFRSGGFFAGPVAVTALTLALLLVLRITVAREPFGGWSLALGLGSGALACLAVLILVSAAWSHAPARSIVEFDRALLYALVLTLTGSLAGRRGDLAVLLRCTGGAFAAIALAGLVTRLFPTTFPITAGVLPERVGFPLTYWNAMGIACAMGCLLALHHTASEREPPAVRVVAAALLAPIAVTLYFTFSRGAIWVLPLGLVLYAVLARPRGLLTALPAAGLPAAVALVVAYHADKLAKVGYATAAAAPQAHRVALAVAVCAVVAALARLAALPLDARLAAVRLPAARERGLKLGLVAAAVVVVVAGGLAAHLPRRIADAKDTFERGQYMAYNADLRTRLTSVVDNGRIDNWRVALDGFRESPLHGTGAGTYALTWQRDRPAPPVHIVDGHSLYLETLSEMGVPGLVFVAVLLATLLGGGVLRLRGPERHAYGAFVATGAMLAVHAGIDWDWEMPALFVWLFGAGGVALAAREGARPAWELGRVPRVAAGLAVLVLAITPWLVFRSQGPLNAAQRDFAAGDCPAAINAALTATERFGVRPEPWEVLGYCDARVGQYALATRAMDAARARDPGNWEYVYGQAIMAGVAGRDPRPDAARALRLNPLEPLARTLVRDLRRARTAARRREVARRAGIPFQ
jgi:O-Antigen ligase